MNKTILTILAFAAVIGVGSFYGGMKYGEQRGLATASQGGNFRATGMGGGRRGGMNGDVVSGEIILKDNMSVTVKLRDGGSKIIFVSDTTQVMKSMLGAFSDLAVGNQIMSFGTANTDGSIMAKSIQIRPGTSSY